MQYIYKKKTIFKNTPKIWANIRHSNYKYSALCGTSDERNSIFRQTAPRIRHINRPYVIDTINIKTSDLKMVSCRNVKTCN
jgi:hypothetical protein